MARRPRKRRVFVLTLAAAAVAAESVALKRRTGRWAGRVSVRCLHGHRFETLWIPGVSITSVRLGIWRIQWCPVGGHLTIVTPVRATEAEPGVEGSIGAPSNVAP